MCQINLYKQLPSDNCSMHWTEPFSYHERDISLEVEKKIILVMGGGVNWLVYDERYFEGFDIDIDTTVDLLSEVDKRKFLTNNLAVYMSGPGENKVEGPFILFKAQEFPYGGNEYDAYLSCWDEERFRATLEMLKYGILRDIPAS